VEFFTLHDVVLFVEELKELWFRVTANFIIACDGLLEERFYVVADGVDEVHCLTVEIRVETDWVAEEAELEGADFALGLVVVRYYWGGTEEQCEDGE